MRRTPVIVGAITCSLATVVGAVAAASPGFSGAAGNAQATYKAALAYAAHEGRALRLAGPRRAAPCCRVTGDTGPTAGTQSLTVKSSSRVGVHSTVSLIGKTGYLRGNAAGLAGILGLHVGRGHHLRQRVVVLPDREPDPWIKFHQWPA